MVDPVPVIATGFTWTAAGAWASFLALVGLLVRQWVPLKKLKKEADEKFRDDLAARVASLEAKLEKKDADHAAALATQRAEYESEVKIFRHRLNNISACFDALLMLIKTDPARAAEWGKQIEEMRANQLVAEAAEKGAVSAARIKGASE